MTKREIAVAEARVCGYYNETGRTWIRLLVESRVSRIVLTDAWAAGRECKLAEERGE